MPTVTATVIAADVTAVDARLAGGRVLVDPATLPATIGWTLKPEGLCRDEACVPVRDRTALLVDGQVDLAAAADALRLPVVVDTVDPEHPYVAIARPAEERRRALRELEAPEFTLPDLHGNPHSLSEWHGRKRLLQAFSSW
jgi:hypothetical protein